MELENIRSAKRRRTSRGKTEISEEACEEEACAKEATDLTDKFHISIAWNLTEPVPEWITLAGDIDVNETVKPPNTLFGVVKAKIGNTVHSIRLGSRTASTGLGGGMLGLA
jgi:hypothetical protein